MWTRNIVQKSIFISSWQSDPALSVWFLRANISSKTLFPHFLDLIQSEDVHQHIHLTTAEPGGTVTLQCAISESYFPWTCWYRQTIKHVFQRVVVYNGTKSTVLVEGFSANMVNGTYNLNIQNITSSDKGIYFCTTGTTLRMEFRNGTFVTVKGKYNTVV